MDRQKLKFMAEIEKSRQSPLSSKENLHNASFWAAHRRNFLIEIQKVLSSSRSYETNFTKYNDYSSDSSDSESEAEKKKYIAEEEDKPSTLQKIIWFFTDMFEEDEVKEIVTHRSFFKIKSNEELEETDKKLKAEFKIRSVRDLIDRWFFKTLAKDLVKIQPEPLKIEAQMLCLNYIQCARMSNYSKNIYSDTCEY